jgi:hypothetical protein
LNELLTRLPTMSNREDLRVLTPGALKDEFEDLI